MPVGRGVGHRAAVVTGFYHAIKRGAGRALHDPGADVLHPHHFKRDPLIDLGTALNARLGLLAAPLEHPLAQRRLSGLVGRQFAQRRVGKGDDFSAVSKPGGQFQAAGGGDAGLAAIGDDQNFAHNSSPCAPFRL